MLLHYSCIVDVYVYIEVTAFNFNDDNADLLIIGINYQIWVMSLHTTCRDIVLDDLIMT